MYSSVVRHIRCAVREGSLQERPQGTFTCPPGGCAFVGGKACAGVCCAHVIIAVVLFSVEGFTGEETGAWPCMHFTTALSRNGHN